ncbi:MAG: purine-nucleoside phosphorylase [Chitinophagaceae bacterium]|nr:purine-nucleoside phosphorylase [Chitinophagaceae bacterium]
MSTLTGKLKETVAFIKRLVPADPQTGIILGSGLGNLTGEIQVEQEIYYRDIPHFPVSTVEGHSGKLIFGMLSGKRVVVMSGRFHIYEGYSPQEVAYPVRVLALLGIKALLISNAAGGVNANFKPGDLMIITDHIGIFTLNPLIGANEEALGPRFPDMSAPYSWELIAKAKAVASANGISLQEGVYFGVTGPSFETRAEYRLIRTLGADAVGMSTVQEVIVAAHMGLPVFGVSVISNIGIRDDNNTVTHQEVLDEAKTAEPKLTAIFKGLVAEL